MSSAMLSPQATAGHRAAQLEGFGRIVLASLFVIAGVHKAIDPETPLRMMASAGLQPAWLLLPLTIALQLICGMLVAIGRRGAVAAALILALYCLAVNLFLHRFWTLSGHDFEVEISLFFKNVTIAGALLMAAGHMLAKRQP